MGEEGIGDSTNRPLPAVFRLIERDFVIHSYIVARIKRRLGEEIGGRFEFLPKKNLGGNGYAGTRAALCGLKRAERTMQSIEGIVERGKCFASRNNASGYKN